MFAKVDPSLMFGNGDVESASLLGTAASSAADGANDSNIPYVLPYPYRSAWRDLPFASAWAGC